MTRQHPRERAPVNRTLQHQRTSTEEVDVTLIDWFLTLSPWERLQASANWARLAGLRRAKSENE